MRLAWDNIGVRHIEVEPKGGIDFSYALKDAVQLAVQEMVTVRFTVQDRVFEVNPMRIITLLDYDQRGLVFVQERD